MPLSDDAAFDRRFGYVPAGKDTLPDGDAFDRAVLSGSYQAPQQDAGPQPAEAGFLESLPQVPLALYGMMNGPQGVAEMLLDVEKAKKGDFEAAKRVRARETVVGGAIGAIPVPGAEALALPARMLVRAGVGALLGGASSAAEAGVSGREILPAAGRGAVVGAIVNPAFGAVEDLVASRLAKQAAMKAAEAEEYAATQAGAAGRGSVPIERGNIELPSGVPGIEGFEGSGVRAGQGAPMGRMLPGPVGEPMGPERIAEKYLPGGMPGSEPIPTRPPAQQEMLGPGFYGRSRQQELLGPPTGKAPNSKLVTERPSIKAGKIAGFEGSGINPTTAQLMGWRRTKMARLTERTGTQDAGMAIVDAQRAGLDREGRLAATSAILGRKVDSYTQLYPGESVAAKEFMRSLASPEGKAPAMELGDAATRSLFTRMLDKAPRGVGDVIDDAALGYHAIMSSGSSFWKNLGTGGVQLADKAEQVRANYLGRIARESQFLDKLSKQFTKDEAIKVGQVLEGAPSPSLKITQGATELREFLQNYSNELTQAGLPPGEGGLPRSWSRQTIDQFGGANREWLHGMFRHMPKELRSGHVQFDHDLNMRGYEENAFKALAMYIDRTAPRLENAKIFGPKNEIANGLLQQIHSEYGKQVYDQASKVYQAFSNPAGRQYSPLANAVREFSTPLFLTYSGIVQPVQVLTNTVAREGVVNTAKGLLKFAVSKDARELAEAAGTAQLSAIDDMVKGGGISDRWIKIIGLKTLDRANRLASGLAAQFRARDIVRAIQNGKATPGILRDAKRLGIDVTNLAEQGYQLTRQQESEAMLRGAVSTQFLSDVLSTPLAKQSSWGQVIYLYKSYALNQGRFIKDLVVDAKAGHWGPLVRYAGAMGTAGVAVGELMRTLRGNETPDDPRYRVLEDLLNVGSFGLFADMLRSVGGGKEGILGAAAGPAISEVAGTTADVGQAATGNLDPLTRRLLRRTVKRVPVVGNQLYEQMAP